MEIYFYLNVLKWCCWLFYAYVYSNKSHIVTLCNKSMLFLLQRASLLHRFVLLGISHCAIKQSKFKFHWSCFKTIHNLIVSADACATIWFVKYQPTIAKALPLPAFSLTSSFLCIMWTCYHIFPARCTLYQMIYFSIQIFVLIVGIKLSADWINLLVGNISSPTTSSFATANYVWHVIVSDW